MKNHYSVVEFYLKVVSIKKIVKYTTGLLTKFCLLFLFFYMQH